MANNTRPMARGQGRIRASQDEQPPLQWQQYVAEGRQALVAGDPQLACQFFVQALDLGYDLLYATAGAAGSEESDVPSGVSYETALASVVLALLNLVESYLAQGRQEMALVRLNRCVSLLASQNDDTDHEGIRECVRQVAGRLADECPDLLARIQSDKPALQALITQLGTMAPARNRMSLH